MRRIGICNGDWGNSYVFSKEMAEGYVSNNYGNMRTIVVRPSMVTSVYKEPLAGYTDSWVTGTGLLCDIASGLTRVVRGNKEVVVEIIPADYVCNFLIVAAAKTSRTNKYSVYNVTTGYANPINWRTISKLYIKEGKKHGYVVLPFPRVYFTKVSWEMSMLSFLSQLVAFGADTWLRLTGRQPRYMKLQRHATSRSLMAQPATDLSWAINTTRAKQLISTLESRDRHAFPCDPETVKWEEYVSIYCKGVKDYMLGNRKNKD